MVTPHSSNVKKMLKCCEVGSMLGIAFFVSACNIGCTSKPLSAPQNGPQLFEEVTRTAGLSYVWEQPKGKSPLNILETIGNGAAFLDFDQDGNLDILLVGDKTALYRGDGHGHFTDISVASGLADITGRHLGCGIGDIDNDGYPDIYLSGYRTGHLLHNINGKRIADITRQSGIPTQPFGTAVTFSDIDADGRLDLYIGNYIQFDASSIQVCKRGNAMTSCPPGAYDGISGHLYRNLGKGRFADITAAWAADVPQGKTLGAAFAPSGKTSRYPQLAIANDEVPGELFLNSGAAFKPIGQQAGIAFSSVGVPHAGMGLDWGDVNNDGYLDLSIMTFSTETKPVYIDDGNGFYTDKSAGMGMGTELNAYVSFGTKWLDFDNDGWLDIMVTNGHTADNIADTGSGETYRQPLALLRNNNGTLFRRIHETALDKPRVGRGLATGDYDNDGYVDALVVDSAGEPVLLHNRKAVASNWLGVRLIGHTSVRDAYGAVITLSIGADKLVRHCHADGSYLSSSDSRVHFGLGTRKGDITLQIRWPSGKTQSVAVPEINRYITIEETR